MTTATSVDPSTNSGGAKARRSKLNDGTSSADLSRTEPQKSNESERLKKTVQKKYRHVVAVHSKTRPSCLSHDSEVAPSFLGFRNLMVIVLGETRTFRSRLCKQYANAMQSLET